MTAVIKLAEDVKLAGIQDGDTLIYEASSKKFKPHALGGSLPAGGTTGQVLTKASDADGDADWEDGGGGGSLLTARVSVSSAEILALHDTPKQIIAAPGAGKMILPVNGSIFYIFGTVPYAIFSAFFLAWGDSDADMALADIGERDADCTFVFGPSTGGGTVATSAYENTGLYISYGSNPTGGDGTALIDIAYRIVDVP